MGGLVEGGEECFESHAGVPAAADAGDEDLRGVLEEGCGLLEGGVAGTEGVAEGTAEFGGFGEDVFEVLAGGFGHENSSRERALIFDQRLNFLYGSPKGDR